MTRPKRKRAAPAAEKTAAPPGRARKRNARFEALEALSAEAAANFGVSYVQRASKSQHGDTYLETGILPLDLALMGGIPENRVTMLVGWGGAGKSTVAARIVAAAQRKYPDRAACYVDAEHTLDLDWCRKHGIDDDQLYLVEPPRAEMVVDIVQGVMATGEASIIVVDSLPALVPEASGNASAYDQQVADRARLVGRMCSKILAGIADAKAAKRKTTIVFINQWRQVIGGIPGRGPSKQMPAGMQPQYLSSVIVDLRNVEQKGQAEDEALSLVQVNKHAFDIRKSKVGNSLRTGEWGMIRDASHPLGEGAIDDYLATLTHAKKFGLYHGEGSKQHFLDGVGVTGEFRRREDAITYLQQHSEQYNLVKRAVIAEWRSRSGLPAIPSDGYLLGWAE